MMTTAIVVGLLKWQVKKIATLIEKGQANYAAGWEVIFISCGGSIPGLTQHEVNLAIRRADSCTEPHILGVSKLAGDKKKVAADQIRPFFRFRWLKASVLNSIHDAPQDFVTSLNAALTEETLWAETVKPDAVVSPLLLPEECFVAGRDVSSLWNQAMEYGEIGNIEAASRTKDRFHSRHWRKIGSAEYRWIDNDSYAFDHRGERHARAPLPRNWKYSFRIPDGFHYDVTVTHGRAFTFVDAIGDTYTVKQEGYLNLDPHGIVR